MTSLKEELEHLSDLTKALNDLPQHGMGNMTEYDTNGTCYVWGLLKNKHTSVVRAYMSDGTVFPEHQHHQTEVFIVYRGGLKFDCVDGSDECVNIYEKGVFTVDPNILHTVTAIGDTEMIAVTIPPDEAYPHA